MKGLVTTISALAAAAAFAEGVTSGNTVGFTTSESAQGFNFYCLPFSSVGYNTSDIQQLKIDDGGADEAGYGAEIFTIWGGAPEVVDGTEFYYAVDYDQESGDPFYFWDDGNGPQSTLAIAPGQGVVIDMTADWSIITSGEVPATPASFTSIQGFNFTGNPYPQAIDIQQIQIDDGGADEAGYGAEIFTIWEGAPDVVDGTEFYYAVDYDQESGDPFYFWDDGNGPQSTLAIAPGQGVVIDMTADWTVTIGLPYTL